MFPNFFLDTGVFYRPELKMSKNRQNINNSKTIVGRTLKFGTNIRTTELRHFAKFYSYTSNGVYFTDQKRNSDKPFNTDPFFHAF